MPHTAVWIELAGAHNVRDLGGLPAGDAQVRPRVLLRGDHLDDLTPEDLAVVREELGLRSVVDLRTHGEQPADPAWLGDLGVTRLHQPLVDFTGTTDPKHLARTYGGDMGGAYRAMLSAAAPAIVRILDFAVQGGRTPVLMHCAAGKDRTGIVVAVLLAAAGVDEPGIVADYVATGQRLERIRDALLRKPQYAHLQDRKRMGGAPASAIEGVLEALRATPGGAQGFLLDHGTTQASLDRWVELLIDPPRG